jgi:mono/diheme cytochrome c family protein
MIRKLALSALPLFFVAPSAWALDAEHGAEVVREQNCLRCHNVRGDGELLARDLSDKILKKYTPAHLTATLWNHMPEMWEQMSRELVGRPQPSERDSEDLFAYLYSLRFTDRAGIASRGERAFDRKNCSGCHRLPDEEDQAARPGRPVVEWRPVVDVFSLVQQMWNHSAQMRGAGAARDTEWERINARDLADLTTFIQLQQGRAPTGQSAEQLTLPDPETGELLFEGNCGGCHPGIIPLEERLTNKTLLDVAAGMWNHLPRMNQVPLVAEGDMASIVSYVWRMQYDQPQGNAVRGGETFREMQCAGCHIDGNVPIIRGEQVFSAFTLMSQWWAHGPLMEQRMQEQGVRWPYMDEQDVADIVAFLNTRP